MLLAPLVYMSYMRSYRNTQARLDSYLYNMSNSERAITPDCSDKTFVYKRKKKGWEAFSCACGSPKQLSPSMKNKEFRCSHCGRLIKIIV